MGHESASSPFTVIPAADELWLPPPRPGPSLSQDIYEKNKTKEKGQDGEERL